MKKFLIPVLAAVLLVSCGGGKGSDDIVSKVVNDDDEEGSVTDYKPEEIGIREILKALTGEEPHKRNYDHPNGYEMYSYGGPYRGQIELNYQGQYSDKQSLFNFAMTKIPQKYVKSTDYEPFEEGGKYGNYFTSEDGKYTTSVFAYNAAYGEQPYHKSGDLLLQVSYYAKSE